MGSDPQSYLAAMDEIAHRECKAEIAELHIKLDAAVADNAALLAAFRPFFSNMRLDHELTEDVVRAFYDAFSGVPEYPEWRSAFLALKKEHPGGALLRAHADEVQKMLAEVTTQKNSAERKQKFIVGIQQLIGTHDNLNIAVETLIQSKVALRAALGTRGRAGCPLCDGSGQHLLHGECFDIRLAQYEECPCRKELGL